MDDEDVKTSKTDGLTVAMEFIENMRALHESLDAYRVLLVEKGYSETAQEQMILDVHRMMMGNINK